MRPFPLLPHSPAVCGLTRSLLSGASFGLKPVTLVVLGSVCMQGDGPSGGSHGVRGRNLRLGCGRAAMAMWVGGRWWLAELGCVGGVSVLGYITCPIFYLPTAAASVDTVSFMKAPSRCPYSFELLRVKTRSLGSDGGGYQWSFPSRRHHLGDLVPSSSISPLLGGLEVSVGS